MPTGTGGRHNHLRVELQGGLLRDEHRTGRVLDHRKGLVMLFRAPGGHYRRLQPSILQGLPNLLSGAFPEQDLSR
jgi:hypothetical protein